MQLSIDAFLQSKNQSNGEPPLKVKKVAFSSSVTSTTVKTDLGPSSRINTNNVVTGNDQGIEKNISFPFASLSAAWRRIEDTTKRLEKGREMVQMLLQIYLESTKDIVPAVLLSTNQLREPWSDLPSVLNFAEISLRKVISKTFGSDPVTIQKLLEKHGDIGVVAEKVKKSQSTTFAPRKPLNVSDVYQKLLQIADTSGASSMDDKSTIISNLLYNGTALDTRYISRLIAGKFRLGLQKKSIVPTLADLLCCIILCKIKGIATKDRISEVYDNLLSYGKVPMIKTADPAIKVAGEKNKTGDDNHSNKGNRNDDESNMSDDIHDDDSDIYEDSNDSVSTEAIDGQPENSHSDLLSIDSKKLRTHCHIVISKAYSSCPSFEAILNQIITHCGEGTEINKGQTGIEGVLAALNSMTIKPGVPVLSMLARPTTSYSEIIQRISCERSFSAEYKYDGFRAQVHYDARALTNKIQIFSRSLENMSKRFPDVSESVMNSFKESKLFAEMTIEERENANFVIDGEICPIHAETGLILPFQYLSRREKDILKAQKDAKQMKESKNRTEIVMYAFDILFLNSRDYLSVDLADRKEALYCAFAVLPRKFEFARAVTCTQDTNLKELLEEAVQNKTEGLIVKILRSRDSWYRPDERSHAWLKLKKDYLEDVGDSFDLVPVAAWMGTGKRTGVLGAYLLASFNEECDQWETVCQLGTGFSDADLAAFHDSFIKCGMKEKPVSIEARLDKEPDLWFDPETSPVWEVKCANLSLSMKHTLCFNSETGQGISLRLPRLLRVRPDKKPWDCTKASVIFEAFMSQPERS
ncbi:DNA ligase [Giardia lamblia P15]|uniref:DNA ligase n=1 Tax=Giardia intestinalis (strain P15) TaxID=658858 RepID=E1EW10_GIAIA|nr:DNA ligase [Giardia lamblia P15]